MLSIDQFIDGRLTKGSSYFSRAEVQSAVELKPQTLTATITRLIKRHRLANPRRDFYLILRPEDLITGAPDPARWINGLMQHLGFDYRISLLRAASFHGSSHQAAMVFQVLTPRQQRDIAIGRHRIQFIYQSPEAFSQTNLPQYVDQLKTDTGYAKIAGRELALLDCTRYFHNAGGINGVAQIVKDIGSKANPRHLRKLAAFFDTATVRRLGYLLELSGHQRQAEALEPHAKKAKTALLLDPTVQPLMAMHSELCEKSAKWKLYINETVEIDF